MSIQEYIDKTIDSKEDLFKVTTCLKMIEFIELLPNVNPGAAALVKHKPVFTNVLSGKYTYCLYKLILTTNEGAYVKFAHNYFEPFIDNWYAILQVSYMALFSGIWQKPEFYTAKKDEKCEIIIELVESIKLRNPSKLILEKMFEVNSLLDLPGKIPDAPDPPIIK